LVTTPTSAGRAAAANRGFETADGDYVVLHDDDDLWHPAFLERTVSHLDDAPDVVAVVVPTDILVERAEGDSYVEVERRPFRPPGELVTLFDLILINRVVPISMLIRRTVLEKLHGWDETLRCVGDWEFNLRLALEGQIDFLRGETLAFWMHRPDQPAGPTANSLYAESADHFEFDRIVRNRALRPDDTHHQIGQLLFLAKFIDERIAEAERQSANRLGISMEQLMSRVERLEALVSERFDQVQMDVEYYSPGATIKRALRRLGRHSTEAQG
jgi:glycosyltransferase involved in cell wall biosynthesis